MNLYPENNKETQLLEVLSSLNQISETINQMAPGDTTGSGGSLQLIVESAIRVVPGSSAVIHTYDQTMGKLEPESRVSAQAEGRALARNPVFSDDAPRSNGIGVRTIQRRRRTFSYEEPDLDVHPYHAALGVQVVGCYPLIVAGQTVGILYIYLYEKREFSQLEQLMLDNFVNQAAMAIYHARRMAGVRRDLARKEEELNRLHRAGLIISSRLRLKETLESILVLALEVTNAHYGIFRLLRGDYLVTSAMGGSPVDRLMIEKIPIEGNSIMAHVARTRQTVLISDLRAAPWSEMYFPLDSGMQMLSELTVPLLNSSGRLEGVLNLESPQAGAFSEDDSHMLQSLATHAVTAIQEARLLDALQEIAKLLLVESQQQVLDHLVLTATDLLNATTGAIWMVTDGQLQLSAAGGDRQVLASAALVDMETLQAAGYARQVHAPFSVLTVPLYAGDSERPLGVFSVFRADAEAGRIVESEWDEKVLTCLAHYAVLALQNDARQQALRLSQEKHWTAETFAAVGDISANLLHNMNNKVGIIPVRVQAIQDKYEAMLQKDSYLNQSLKQIERSAMEAMQIVQENLSHLRPIRMEKVKIEDCVLEVIHTNPKPAGVKIQTLGLEDLPPVLAGRQSLTLVFKNLIENATAAMNGSGSITIQGRNGAVWVEVELVDDGPGIPIELHDKIFELSYSGRAGMQPGKLGFGLWWVKTMMTRLGGAVTVESDGRNGTRFALRLPKSEEKA